MRFIFRSNSGVLMMATGFGEACGWSELRLGSGRHTNRLERVAVTGLWLCGGHVMVQLATSGSAVKPDRYLCLTAHASACSFNYNTSRLNFLRWLLTISISTYDLHRYHYIKKLNSMALVRERTIPTERPPPVGEVSANFCG
jgi:hypothetical protein